MEARVKKIEGDLYRTEPDNPGVVIRLDRVERLFSVILKVGAVLGACGVAWKALEVVGQVVAGKLAP